MQIIRRMNHPVLTSSSTSRRLLLHTLCFAAGIALTLLLLMQEEESPSLAAAIASAPGTLPSSPPPAAPSTPPQPPEAAQPLPEVTTPADMNRVVDGGLPLDDKIAALAAAMRRGDSRTAADAARRAIFLLKGPDYPRLVTPLLLDTSLPSSAMQVLALNLHDRATEYSLPILARIKNIPGHPLHAEAAETLEFYLHDKASATGETLTQNVEEWLRGQREVSSSR